MPVDAETFAVYFRLLFKKGESPPSSQCTEKPAGIARRLNRIDSVIIGGHAAEVAAVATWRMIGVKRPPIGGHLVVRVVRFAFPEQLNITPANRVAGGVEPSCPGQGDGCIPTLRIGEAGMVVRRLTATVGLHQAGQILAALRVAVDGGHHGLLPFEDANPEADHLQNNTIFFPFSQHLYIQRLGPRIKSPPQRLKGLRCLATLQRQQRLLCRGSHTRRSNHRNRQ